MTTAQGLKPTLTIRFHLTDGSIHSFVQTDDAAARKLWEGIDPARLFARPRIVIGSEHSKAVFVSAETLRVDFLHHSFQCWEFPGRSEEHTSELQSQSNLVCRLLLEKKKKKKELKQIIITN